MHVWAIDLSGVPYHQLARTGDYLKGVDGWAEAYLGETEPVDGAITVYAVYDTDSESLIDSTVGRLARLLPEGRGGVTVRVRGARLAHWSVWWDSGPDPRLYTGERQALRLALAPAGGFLVSDSPEPGDVYAPGGVDVAALAGDVLGESVTARVVAPAAPVLSEQGA